MRASVDIETALYNSLTTDKYSASAHSIPATLGDTLPHIHVTRTGGINTGMVIDTHQVAFDVYAVDQADAMSAACALCDWVRGLVGQNIGAICYQSEVTTLPYGNPDPRHPTIGRATLKAQILTRTRGDSNA